MGLLPPAAHGPNREVQNNQAPVTMRR